MKSRAAIFWATLIYIGSLRRSFRSVVWGPASHSRPGPLRSKREFWPPRVAYNGAV